QWIARMLKPHSRYSGAVPMPLKLLCEAITATTKISRVPEIGLAPGNRASGECATTSPAAVVSRIVQVVALTRPPVGRNPASQRAPSVATRAIASHSSTASPVTGAVLRTGATARSALERAPVQRLNAGASLATENSSATQTE